MIAVQLEQEWEGHVHFQLAQVVERCLESYVFRRAVCGIPTNSMNKTFATFTRALKKDRYLESIAAHFLLLPAYRRFPADDEFQREMQAKDLYNFRSRSYRLRRLENHDRKERVPVDEYTIEHILPQNENLSAQWKSDLGAGWERIQTRPPRRGMNDTGGSCRANFVGSSTQRGGGLADFSTRGSPKHAPFGVGAEAQLLRDPRPC
jgi:uncharacterized protein DUF1524